MRRRAWCDTPMVIDIKHGRRSKLTNGQSRPWRTMADRRPRIGRPQQQGVHVTTKTALITGITGQDGSYLAELLLDKGYAVHGLVRRASAFNTQRIDHIYRDRRDPTGRLTLHYGDLTDGVNLVNLLHKIRPDEVYNLGAMSHVKVSFEMPEYTASTDAVGTIRLLEAIRASGLDCRFYQASTSEMFGASPPPQNEMTPFYPRSPYGAAKLYAYWVTVNYREAYGLFAVNGILFNHESPRRGETFVTRKITRAVAHIKAGLQDELYLGNLDSVRDWGHAPSTSRECGECSSTKSRRTSCSPPAPDTPCGISASSPSITWASTGRST